MNWQGYSLGWTARLKHIDIDECMNTKNRSALPSLF
jgi:hypothetical protein